MQTSPVSVYWTSPSNRKMCGARSYLVGHGGDVILPSALLAQWQRRVSDSQETVERPQVIVRESPRLDAQSLAGLDCRQIEWIPASNTTFGAVNAGWSGLGALDPLLLAAHAPTTAFAMVAEFAWLGGIGFMCLHFYTTKWTLVQDPDPSLFYRSSRTQATSESVFSRAKPKITSAHDKGPACGVACS